MICTSYLAILSETSEKNIKKDIRQHDIFEKKNKLIL